VVTYPPDPLPLGIFEGKGDNFREGLAPLSAKLTPITDIPWVAFQFGQDGARVSIGRIFEVAFKISV